MKGSFTQFMSKLKNKIFIFGRYGSGKTTVALNFAFMLSETGEDVTIADLDIVNPYFRSSDFAEKIKSHSINLVAPKPGDTIIKDSEIIPEIQSALKDNGTYVVADIGDDDEGMEAVTFLKDELSDGLYDFLYVVNFNKSSTSTPQLAAEDAQKVFESFGIKCTGIINNTQTSGETDQQTMSESVEKAEEMSKILGVPLVYNCYDKNIDLSVLNAMPIEIFVTPPWFE